MALTAEQGTGRNAFAPSHAAKAEYRAEIDGLRAIAVLGVVFFHFKLALFKGGFAGVDVFFVISGYLITRNILADASAGIFRFPDFMRGAPAGFCRR